MWAKKSAVTITLLGGLVLVATSHSFGQTATDPGVRGGGAAAGGPLPGLTNDELTFFSAGFTNFQELETIASGLGPSFNLDSCAGCHAQPTVGGASPPVNPEVAIATAFGAQNIVPSFVQSNGPIVEARFKFTPNGAPDNGVHSLFTIRGRVDSSGSAAKCSFMQEDFNTQFANGNISLRTPPSIFGLGLVQSIDDKTLGDNLNAPFGSSANYTTKKNLGIGGVFNTNPNTGSITRFGWKAQNVSLLLFSGEAYNVEEGITNELFSAERVLSPSCQLDVIPNDSTVFDQFEGLTASATVSDIERFTAFMLFSAPPTPSTTTPGGAASISNGRTQFINVGCAFCHSPTIQTSKLAEVPAMANQPVNLFSDLALHHMGATLADGISQGNAGGDQFRTALLWGAGQRIFFLHDGRTSNIVQAIMAHVSGSVGDIPPSEANAVIANFLALSPGNQQDLVNFLRSL